MSNPTHETSVVNLESTAIPPGTPIDPAVAHQAVCADLAAGAPRTVLQPAINNTLGSGRLRVTTRTGGVAFTLKITGASEGIPTTIRWALAAGAAVVVGPYDSGGRAITLSKILKIETVTSGGAPVDPGAAVTIEWERRGGRIAAEKSATAIGVYPGDAADAAPPGKLMRVQDGGRGQAKCIGGWAALDDLVVGAGGGLRKRAAMGDEAAVSLGSAAEVCANGAIGQVDL